MKLLLTLILFCFSMGKLDAQNIYLTLNEKIKNSELIVEGRVVNQFSFENEEGVFTANELEVCQTLYGKTANKSGNNEKVFIATYGGIKGRKFNQYSHVLNLSIGYEGIFFLRNNSTLQPVITNENQIYYDVFGQEQGFIPVVQNENGDINNYIDIQGNSSSIHEIIEEINLKTNQNSSPTFSCIQNSNSGLAIKFDNLNITTDFVEIDLSFKGLWSNSYEIEELKTIFYTNTEFNLSEYNVEVSKKLNLDYKTEVQQIDSKTFSVVYSKNSSLDPPLILNSNYQPLIKIKIPNSFVQNVKVKTLEPEGKFLKNNEVKPFKDYIIERNPLYDKLFVAPKITSFEPAEVAAGILADNSSGTPIYQGFVTIKGTGFGNIDPKDFEKEIPNNSRVDFTREEDVNSPTTYKVSPLASDYVKWTDTEIKVWVPTTGFEVNNSTIINPLPKSKNSVTGKIHVKTKQGYSSSSTPLTVKFAHFNLIDDNGGTANKFSVKKKLVSKNNNGGYYFIFDPSFNNIYPNDPAAAKQDIIDALCEWNKITKVKLEVVNTCPTGQVCAKIKYSLLPSNPNATVALAQGEGGDFICPGSSNAFVTGLLLTYNTAITDWRPSKHANPSDPHVIKSAAFHEIGHLLQLGHVYNKNSTMHPYYSSNLTIDAEGAKGGGTHVSNISTSSCNAPSLTYSPIVQGEVASCGKTVTSDLIRSTYQIYPNVTSEEIIIDILEEDNMFPLKIKIIDIYGKIVDEKTIMPTSGNRVSVNNLPNGLYHISFDNKHKPFKFIKL